jgi:hypothetical protein
MRDVQLGQSGGGGSFPGRIAASSAAHPATARARDARMDGTLPL